MKYAEVDLHRSQPDPLINNDINDDTGNVNTHTSRHWNAPKLPRQKNLSWTFHSSCISLFASLCFTSPRLVGFVMFVYSLYALLYQAVIVEGYKRAYFIDSFCSN